MPTRWFVIYGVSCAFIWGSALLGYVRGRVDFAASDALYYILLGIAHGALALLIDRLEWVRRLDQSTRLARGIRAVQMACYSSAICLLPITGLLISSSVNVQHTSAELVDSWLAWPEELLGLTQIQVRRWAEANHWIPLLTWAYMSFRWQTRWMVIYWAAAEQNAKPIMEVATAFALCAAVAQPLFLLLPADGPAVYYGWSGEMPSHLQAWFAMRAGASHTITHLDGYASAPSFHLVFVVLLLRAWWNTPFRLAAIVLNLLMLFSTWVIGWHYLTDMVAGATLAGFALLVVCWADDSKKNLS